MKVEPAQLTAAASVVDANRTELRIAGDAAHAAVESALPGWAGASAVALAHALTRWRYAVAAIDSALRDQHDGLVTAAAAYPTTDLANSRALAF